MFVAAWCRCSTQSAIWNMKRSGHDCFFSAIFYHFFFLIKSEKEKKINRFEQMSFQNSILTYPIQISWLTITIKNKWLAPLLTRVAPAKIRNKDNFVGYNDNFVMIGECLYLYDEDAKCNRPTIPYAIWGRYQQIEPNSFWTRTTYSIFLFMATWKSKIFCIHSYS